jgi:hypothetical protein
VCVASAHAGVLGDAVEITQRARKGVLEWSRKRSPKMEEDFHEYLQDRYFVISRGASCTSIRANFVIHA